MSTYVIAGASRGIGYEFVVQLSQNPSNIVIGLARNKAATEARLAKDNASTTNVTILAADVTDIPSLQKAAVDAKNVVGEKGVDVLINNAALQDEATALVDLKHFEQDPVHLRKKILESFEVNVIGVANTIQAFLPLVKISKEKKVITISSGMADLDLVNEVGVGVGAPYTISKAAVNMLIAKYNVAYAPQGILFMSISPGFVNTREGKQPTPEEMEAAKPLIEAFARYKPDFKGQITTQESVGHVLKLVNRATVKEFGGAFVSHFGDKQWL